MCADELPILFNSLSFPTFFDTAFRGAVQPKVIDRFPIRILGSTTRPTADVGLQDSFDLSVQGCTEISSLLVLLYTRLRLAHPNTFCSLKLNAIRLWHLDEDRLIRLSIGNIASNNITPKSILCYTVGKRTGKSFVHVYADKSKVGRVEVDVELCCLWQAKETDEDLEEVSTSAADSGCNRFILTMVDTIPRPRRPTHLADNFST